MDRLLIPLFFNITDDEWTYLEKNNFFRIVSYKRNDYIFHMGDITDETGIVINGCVTIETIDLWGNKSILSSIPDGHVFAETYSFCHEPMQVSVTAARNSKILFFNINRLLHDKRPGTASLQNKLLNNMLAISMHKNLTLSNRIFCTAPKTIRSRLLIFLSGESRKAGSQEFSIPYDRQQLADYLNVERTALSKELGKMQKDGLISFKKNHFIITAALPG